MYHTSAHINKAAILPNLDHFDLNDAKHVYEPSDDTFLLCDSINKDRDYLVSLMQQSIATQGTRIPAVVEIGSGSGCVISYVSMLLKQENVCCFKSIATDINSKAASLTRTTSARNGVEVDVVITDFTSGLDLNGSVDILLFNPPYVPTESDEVCGTGIEASWAGGVDGREVIDRFIPLLNDILSPQGVCYLLLVEENKPSQLMGLLSKRGLPSQVVLKRRARNEMLYVIRISREGSVLNTFV